MSFKVKDDRNFFLLHFMILGLSTLKLGESYLKW